MQRPIFKTERPVADAINRPTHGERSLAAESDRLPQERVDLGEEGAASTLEDPAGVL